MVAGHYARTAEMGFQIGDRMDQEIGEAGEQGSRSER